MPLRPEAALSEQACQWSARDSNPRGVFTPLPGYPAARMAAQTQTNRGERRLGAVVIVVGAVMLVVIVVAGIVAFH